MAAPEGNKFAVGNDGGRPPLYDDPETLAAAIEDYFNPRDQAQTKAGTMQLEQRTTRQKVTVCGLALHLGFESRNSLYDYKEKEEFSGIIKRALLRVEMSYEERLGETACTGAIFALKNMGWKDKSESDVNFKGNVNLIIKPQEGNDPLPD